MRTVRMALAASLIGHTAALAGWLGWDAARPPRRADPPPAVVVEVQAPAPPEPEPVAVVLLDPALPAPPAPPPEAQRQALVVPPRRPALSAPIDRRLDRDRVTARPVEPAPGSANATGAIAIREPRPAEPATGEPAAGEPATGEAGGAPVGSLRMRRRAPDSLGPSATFLEDFLARSKPLAPPPDIPYERISDEIADIRRQMGRAAREGNEAKVGALRHELVARYNALAAEELKPSGGGTYKADKETFVAKVAADGSVELEDKWHKLDTQDHIMKRMGSDPYAREKLALLDRTRDQRVALGERRRSVMLARSTELMRKNIERLWASNGDLAARKRGLFELWDDCAETGSEDEIAAGAAARSFVLAVIHARLRGADAYTAAELAAFNARRSSKAMFAPHPEP